MVESSAASSPRSSSGSWRARRRAAQRERSRGPAGPPARRTEHRWLRRTRRGALIVASVVVFALVASTAYVTSAVVRSRPTISGEIAVTGLGARVEIIRDSNGIPTILAATPEDLWFAQGYVHAQDRFWEMDFRRHVTSGRLSELFGASQVDTDAFIRTLGWRRTAEAEVEDFDDETAAMLQAYAAGVNAWMQDRGPTLLSLEHSLLPLAGPWRYQPEPWTPADSVAWIKAMAWDLSTVEDDLVRARLSVTDLGPGRSWRDLYPPPPSDHEPILPAESGQAQDPGETTRAVTTTALAQLEPALATLTKTVANLPRFVGSGEHVGSNSWVIAGSRSATGGALLANDPHLEPSLPSLWYQIGLRCEPVSDACPYQVTGFSFSGMPGVIIGRTDHVAWGLTNLASSTADLVIERLDGDQYQAVGNRWLDLQVHTETIRVAGGDDVEITIRSSANGPIISDVMGDAGEVARGRWGDRSRDAPVGYDHAIALRWTALEATSTVAAVARFARLTSWDDFVTATALFETPTQSVVYADADGNIGYRAPGRFPARRSADTQLPVEGWDPATAWDGYVEPGSLPWVFNPSRGMIVAANQDTLPADGTPTLTRDPNPGYRSQRIVELLGDRDQLTVDDLVEIQLDLHNANAAVLVPALLAVDDQGMRRVAAMQQVLAEWDLRDARDAAGAAAFNATWRHLLALTFHDELPQWAYPTGSGRWWNIVHGLLDQPRSAWWDDLTTLETETRDDILLAAMVDAYDELANEFGDDTQTWRWGALHTFTMRHATFGSSGVGPVEWLFNRGPLETEGGSDVVNAIGWDASEGYEVSRIPSLRMVVDLSAPDDGRWIHAGGASGRPFTRHYYDQAERWRDGGFLPMVTTPAAVRQAAHDRLILLPAP